MKTGRISTANKLSSGCGSVWSRALRSGRKSRRFKSSHPDHFFALIPRQKNMKPEKASLHAPQVRFMAQRAASYFALCAKCFIKPPFQMKHCSAKAPQYEASPLRSDMKHSLRSYDEKMKKEFFRL